MNKERRLGRGLEALLGQIPAHNVEQASLPVQTAPPAGPAPSAAFRLRPSTEAMFWLDAPHATPGQLAAQPHHRPTRAATALCGGLSCHASRQTANPPGRRPLRG